MTVRINTPEEKSADAALKDRHRAMWALGDYPAVVRELITELGPTLVHACDIRPGERVLDVAAGDGNVGIPAALRGADVVASDLTPELVAAGARLAEQAGAQIDWRVDDVEALPYADGIFDVVTSCLGVMFAPHHQQGADQIVRVTRPGGRIGLINWTPEGFVGQMFATMKPYAPPPPPGAQPPPLWGRPDHLHELFGDRVTDVVTTRRTVRVDRFSTGEAFRDFFKAYYGPTIVTYRHIADDPQRVAALDAELVDLARRHDLGGGALEFEYLVFTARKR
jgi:ubiquinone/menaquinone biosynthesis C-methylase UbiE